MKSAGLGDSGGHDGVPNSTPEAADGEASSRILRMRKSPAHERGFGGDEQVTAADAAAPHFFTWLAM